MYISSGSRKTESLPKDTTGLSTEVWCHRSDSSCYWPVNAVLSGSFSTLCKLFLSLFSNWTDPFRFPRHQSQQYRNYDACNANGSHGNFLCQPELGGDSCLAFLSFIMGILSSVDKSFSKATYIYNIYVIERNDLIWYCLSR